MFKDSEVYHKMFPTSLDGIVYIIYNSLIKTANWDSTFQKIMYFHFDHEVQQKLELRVQLVF